MLRIKLLLNQKMILLKIPLSFKIKLSELKRLLKHIRQPSIAHHLRHTITLELSIAHRPQPLQGHLLRHLLQQLHTRLRSIVLRQNLITTQDRLPVHQLHHHLQPHFHQLSIAPRLRLTTAQCLSIVLQQQLLPRYTAHQNPRRHIHLRNTAHPPRHSITHIHSIALLQLQLQLQPHLLIQQHNTVPRLRPNTFQGRSPAHLP